MKQLFFLLSGLWLLTGCDSDDNSQNRPPMELQTLAFTAVRGTTPYNGLMDVYPCRENSSIYFGNYRGTPPTLTPIPGTYLVVNGTADPDKGLTVTLPLGTYDIVYWGYSLPPDTVISYPATTTPAITLGFDLRDQGYKLRPVSFRDTLYSTTENFVYANRTVNIGSDLIGVTLDRPVAGLNVQVRYKRGGALDGSIDSIRVLVGSIASQLNLFTAAPMDQTKTVVVPLRFSPSRFSAYNTVTVFPSGPAPQVTVELTLENGNRKTYVTKMTDPLTADNMRTLTLNIGEIYSSSSTGNDFEVTDWTESNQTIDL